MSNFKFVNLWQSKEERQGKYWLARSCGANAAQATVMRDWRLSKIERRFGLIETYNPHTKSYTRQLNTAKTLAPRLDQEPATV